MNKYIKSFKSNQIFTDVIKHAPIYFSSSFISAVIGIFMSKYYTYVFQPSDYGILALYGMMLQYVQQLISLNMDGSASRLYFDYKDDRRNIYLNSIFIWICMMCFVVLVLGLFLSSFIIPLIEPNTDSLYFVTLFTGIVMAVNALFNRVLINEKESRLIFKNSLISVSVFHSVAIASISGLGFGVLGRLLGQLISVLVNAVAIQFDILKQEYIRYKQTFNWPMVKETIFLAIPSVLTTLQGLLFVYLDRIFLKYFHGNSEVGIYSFAFLVGKGFSMVYEAISNILTPRCYELMKKDYKNGIQELEKFSVLYCMCLIVLTLGVVFFSPLIIQLLSNKNYTDAASVLPFIVYGFMVGGIYKIPSVVLGFHKVVWFYPFLAFFAFGINGILNYLLIPEYKEVGAAFASFIGLFLYSLVLQLMAMKYHQSKKYKLAILGLYSVVLILVVSNYFREIG
eukprot:COSAG01_NODE_755_length_13819_cov_130.671939_7_plen_453_part_00